VLIAICAAACAALVYAEWRLSIDHRSRQHERMRTIGKAIASAAFVVYGLPAFGGGPFQTAVVIGLVLGALGDLALLGRSNTYFLLGLVAFLGGHIAYVIGLAQLEYPLYWIVLAGRLGTFSVIAGIIALRWLWPHLGAMRWPVVVYVLAIVAMVLGAFAAYGTGALPEPQRTYLALGAALFFASDLAVAREKFVARDVRNKLLGLPAYYAAQLLIASAIQ
jgi:uncharacterized membrane protein YhhN